MRPLITMRAALPLRERFNDQRGHAKDRGIPFLLTFEEWLSIWEASGHLHERGPRRGQFVMARYGDKGPYAVGNVKIITNAENTREGSLGNKYWCGKRHSEEAKRKIGEANRGRKLATKGKPLSTDQRAKISNALRGRRFTANHRHNLSEAAKRLAPRSRNQDGTFVS